MPAPRSRQQNLKAMESTYCAAILRTWRAYAKALANVMRLFTQGLIPRLAKMMRLLSSGKTVKTIFKLSKQRERCSKDLNARLLLPQERHWLCQVSWHTKLIAQSLPLNNFRVFYLSKAADAVAARGVCISVVRLSPTVHGEGDHGFIPLLINIAREKGVSAYIGEGKNRWSAVHRLDSARLYRLALTNKVPGARFHAVAESSIPFREIAVAIGHGLGIPVVSISAGEASAHFGWFRHFAELDAPVSAEKTREQLGWHPSQPTLLDDINKAGYFR